MSVYWRYLENHRCGPVEPNYLPGSPESFPLFSVDINLEMVYMHYIKPNPPDNSMSAHPLWVDPVWSFLCICEYGQMRHVSPRQDGGHWVVADKKYLLDHQFNRNVNAIQQMILAIGIAYNVSMSSLDSLKEYLKYLNTNGDEFTSTFPFIP